jgi:hypothetical protein
MERRADDMVISYSCFISSIKESPSVEATLLCRFFIIFLADVATRYGLDGPVRIPLKARFSAPVQTGPGAHPASYTMGTGSFPGIKRQERGVNHPSPSRTEVKETVEIYLYSLSGLSWSVIGRTLLLFLDTMILDMRLLRFLIYVHFTSNCTELASFGLVKYTKAKLNSIKKCDFVREWVEET